MSARQRLDGYLRELRSRLRTLIYLRAAAVIAGGALLLTLAFVAWLAAARYAPAIALSGRIALGALLVIVVAGLLWWPLRKLARADGAYEFERRLPEQQGRIQTYLDVRRREAEQGASPLTELLAEDAASIAARTPTQDIVPRPKLWMAGAIAAAASTALVCLLAMGPGHWGFGSRHLWLGAELPREAVPLRRILVSPGDVVVRRNGDLAIRAVVEGFDPQGATVYVRFEGEQQWQRAPMQAARDGAAGRTFDFKLYALRGPLRYYVAADDTTSAEHGVTVADLPRIEKMRLTYSYPQWTGLEPLTEETLRDIRAVAETEVKVEVFADATLEAPVLIVDGEPVALERDGEAHVGTLKVTQPGRYHVGAQVAGERVALSEEYPIEVVADERPTIQIARPGRDWRATSIEEVPIQVQAQDDFRIQKLELRYAVNGGEWRSMALGSGKDIDVQSLLQMEELTAPAPSAGRRLEPGDVVAYYAVANDRHHSVETDLFMVQVQPFERRFTQAGGNGGGGSAADEQGAISERQREILLATWNLQRSHRRESRSREQLQENARMLSQMQATLAEQARTVAERTRARMSVEEDERIKTFVESMDAAARTMTPAIAHLRRFRLEEAVPIEQQALQQLLRAEAAFRDVQVAMQREGGSQGGQEAARNFTEMFELEMDVEKNQYESQAQLSMQNQREELDEALRKLKELAARQEKLAQESRRETLGMPEQRWRQEQLRREAEDLRRQLAELARSEEARRQAANRPSATASGTDGNESGAASGERQRGQSAPSGAQSQVQNALSSLQNALDDMRAANQHERAAEAQRAAQEASANLGRALEHMDRPQEGGGLDRALERFADRTQALARSQRQVESELFRALSQAQTGVRGRGMIDPREAAQIAAEKQRMANELEALQRQMREAVHQHRNATPRAARKLGEIVNELESSGIAFRINRSSAEVLYGRARDAAPREGLIAEGLEQLEQQLREAATLAANDQRRQGTQATPEELLAQLGELRRALGAPREQAREEEQPFAALEDAPETGSTDGEAWGERGGEPASGSQADRPGTDRPASDRSAASSEQPAQLGATRGDRRRDAIGSDGSDGLAAWNPATRSGSLQGLELDERRVREARAVSERVQSLADRMGRGRLSEAELRALQRMAHELRQLAGNPVATHPDTLSKLIDQLELAALAAVQRADRGTTPRSTVQGADAAEYREAVAEYYRRLGGS